MALGYAPFIAKFISKLKHKFLSVISKSGFGAFNMDFQYYLVLLTIVILSLII